MTEETHNYDFSHYIAGCNIKLSFHGGRAVFPLKFAPITGRTRHDDEQSFPFYVYYKLEEEITEHVVREWKTYNLLSRREKSQIKLIYSG